MLKKSQHPTVVFTDGACSGNPGSGGWGAIIVRSDDLVEEMGGHAPATTNNQMELTGAIEALRALMNHPGPIQVYTDSTYVIRGITQWIFAWLRRGWVTKEGEPVSNSDLWKNLFSLVSARSKAEVSWHYIRGHTGIVGNERTDEIAVSFSKSVRPNLYRGSIAGYELDILKIPKDTSLPESQTASTKSKTPFSYLSLIKQIPKRHKTWGECEQRVRGQSGAKFKKVMSEEEESAVLASWGFSKGDLK